MTPPCVVPTFRPYAAENLEFGGFYASSCESRVNRRATFQNTLAQIAFRADKRVQIWDKGHRSKG